MFEERKILPMPIKIRCACGNVMLAPEERVGQTGNCPACNRAITVDLPAGSEGVPEQAGAEGPAQQPHQPLGMQKVSFVNRLFSALVYLVFFGLLGSLIMLHYSSDRTLSRIQPKKPAFLKKYWQENRDTFLYIKYQHYCVFQKFMPKRSSKENSQ